MCDNCKRDFGLSQGGNARKHHQATVIAFVDVCERIDLPPGGDLRVMRTCHRSLATDVQFPGQLDRFHQRTNAARDARQILFPRQILLPVGSLDSERRSPTRPAHAYRGKISFQSRFMSTTCQSCFGAASRALSSRPKWLSRS